jgi:mono/diheme cytochrome c family protein
MKPMISPEVHASSLVGRASSNSASAVGAAQQAALQLPTARAVSGARRPARALLSLGALLATLVLSSRPARAIDTKKTFNQRCTACHTFGKGVKVGPDLKGVTARRQRPWLLKFIRSSQGVIKNGDPVASELFQRFKQQRMPDWTDLSPQDINAILDWLAADGPEQKEPDERDAELATAADLARARALFDGAAPLASGGLACASCHAVREGSSRRGGTLGPELTDAYVKYRDRALTLFLKRPCTPRQPEMDAARYLTPDESFALKGYLRQVAMAAAPAGASPLTDAKRGSK